MVLHEKIIRFLWHVSESCDEPCTMADKYEPVCGSDGRTYTGMCELNNAYCRSHGRIYWALNGPCKSKL